MTFPRVISSGWLSFLVLGTMTMHAPAQIDFADVTREAALIEPLAGILGHGGALGDFDGDDRLDIFVGGFSDRRNGEYAPVGRPVPNRLFRNLGNGRFEWLQNSPVESFGRTSGAVFADLDNNGTLELYVANNARPKAPESDSDSEPQRSAKTLRSQLFRNDGGEFVDISRESGACPDSLLSARNVGVFDYDGDGLLDLFIVEDKFTPRPRSVLLRNLGGLKFRDVTSEAGLPEDIYGLGLAVGDLNDDGKPDFLVGHSNRLFLSQPKHRYREAHELSSVFAHQPRHSEDWACGVALGDLNRDGRLDVVIAAHSTAARNRVFLHEGVTNGTPRFREMTEEAGLGDVVPARCPHVEIQDFDNDGWPDIYFSAGWLDGDTFTPLVFRNTDISNGRPRFLPPRPIKAPMHYYPAGPSGDLDGDGRMDLLLVNWFNNNHSRLLRNVSPPRNWCEVQVRGKRMNRSGIGAKVTVLTSGGKRIGYQEIGIGYGYASGQPAAAHFGLAAERTVDVRVTFPGGRTISRNDVRANQRLLMEEP
jgi:enediyne biosynthesis protein E4